MLFQHIVDIFRNRASIGEEKHHLLHFELELLAYVHLSPFAAYAAVLVFKDKTLHIFKFPVG